MYYGVRFVSEICISSIFLAGCVFTSAGRVDNSLVAGRRAEFALVPLLLLQLLLLGGREEEAGLTSNLLPRPTRIISHLNK